MKSISVIIISILFTLNIIGGELKGDIKIGEWGKSFHAELHDNNIECYLVTIYKAKAGKNHIRKPQLDFRATIVGIVKGGRKVGDKIEFDRVSDGGFRDSSEYEGEMYYVFYHKAPMNGSPIQGQFYIDSQDPLSMFKYTKKLAKIVSQHPQKTKMQNKSQ